MISRVLPDKPRTVDWTAHSTAPWLYQKCILVDGKHRHRSMDDWLLQSKMIYQCNIYIMYSRSDSVQFVQVSGRKDSEIMLNMALLR